MNIYEEMVKVCLADEIGSHNSDLYVPVKPETKEIIEKYEFKASVSTFRDNISGRLYYDIPFAYSPYWKELNRA